MRTTLTPNAPMRPQSVTPISDGPIALGQVELIGLNGEVAKSWQIVKSKCLVGSSPSCFVQINDPGIHEQHLSLVFGKRHTLLRAAGPTKIRDRNVREWLIDVPTEVSLGSVRLVIHPFRPVSETVVQVERLIDQAARLCKDQSFVSSRDDLTSKAIDAKAIDWSNVAQGSPIGMQTDPSVDETKESPKDENLIRLENIESLLNTLQSSLERFRETVTLESKQSTEAVAQSLSNEFETFGQSLFSSLSQQMTQHTETQQSFVSNLSERVVDRLDVMDQQLVSVKESSLRSSEELLQRASAYQEWIENRLNEVVAQRAELIDAIQALRNEIQLNNYQAQTYSAPVGSNVIHSAESFDRIDRSSEANVSDQRIAESLERAQLQLRSYNQEIQQLATERHATEQQMVYLVRDRQAVEDIDPSTVQEAYLPETLQEFEEHHDHASAVQEYVSYGTEEGYVKEWSEQSYNEQLISQQQEAYQGQQSGQESLYHQVEESVEDFSQSEYENNQFANNQYDSNQYDSNQYVENRNEDPPQVPTEYEDYPTHQEALYQEPINPEQDRTSLDSQEAIHRDSDGYSETHQAFEPEEPTLQNASSPKLPAWFTASEPIASEVNIEPANEQGRDTSKSQRLQEMLRQVSNNFREPNYDLDRSEKGSEGSLEYALNPSESNANNFQAAEDSYATDYSEVTSSESEESRPLDQDGPVISGLESSKYFSGFISDESNNDHLGSASFSSAHGSEVDRFQTEATTAPSMQAREAPDSGSEAAAEEESIEQYMQRLLHRVRKGSDSEPIALATTTRSSASRQESRAPRQEGPSEDPKSESIAPVKQEPLTQASFVPRKQAPELRDDLNMLRELANTNARGAINRSDIRRGNSTFYFKLAVTGVAATSAVSLFMLNGFRINMPFAGMVSAAIVTFLWGYDSLRHFKKLKARKPEPSEVKLQPSSPVEASNPRQNQENRWRPTPV